MMSAHKKILWLFAWLAGCGGGVLIERSGRENAEQQTQERVQSQLQMAPHPSEVKATWQALRGSLLVDRYAAMLALLDDARSNDEMFRIFEGCLPNPYLRAMVAKTIDGVLHISVVESSMNDG